jgi:hypothetical protein
LYLQSFDQSLTLQDDLIRSPANFCADLLIGFISCKPPQELFFARRQGQICVASPALISPSSLLAQEIDVWELPFRLDLDQQPLRDPAPRLRSTDDHMARPTRTRRSAERDGFGTRPQKPNAGAVLAYLPSHQTMALCVV